MTFSVQVGEQKKTLSNFRSISNSIETFLLAAVNTPQRKNLCSLDDDDDDSFKLFSFHRRYFSFSLPATYIIVAFV